MKTKVLRNGIRVMTVPLKGLRAATVEVFVKIGSKYERTGEHGLSHFLEHMAFKGTPKRPSATALVTEIDSKGANYNAGTQQESTSYYITTVKENLPWAIELLADILQNPLMEEKETLKERGVIAEEIRMYQDNPIMGLSGDFFNFMLDKSPIGCWDIAGTAKEVLGYQAASLRAFRNRYLDPKRMVVMVAGDIGEEEKVISEVVEQWEKWKSTAVELPSVVLCYSQEKEKLVKREVEQGHFCVGMEGISSQDKRKHTLELLETILAGNSSSRLTQAIREERGWAYYVTTVGQTFQEGGIVAIQSGVRMDKLEEAVELVKEIMLNLKNDIKEEELQRAKDYTRGRLGLLMDRSNFWTSYMGEKWLLEDKTETPVEELKQLEKVTLNEVKALSAELFEESKIRKMVVKG